MPRKKLPIGEKLKLLRVFIKEKHIEKHTEDVLKDVAVKSIENYINQKKTS